MDFDELCKRYGIHSRNYRLFLDDERLETLYHQYSEDFRKLESLVDATGNSLREAFSPFYNARITGRAKDQEHFIVKVIRDANDAYNNCNSDRMKQLMDGDYRSLFNDTIGFRVILLRKSLKPKALLELIKAYPNYTRVKVFYTGLETKPEESKDFADVDHRRLVSSLRDAESPYNGIHVNLPASDLNPSFGKYNSEIQIRSYFEEAWGEIDHDVKYPFDMDDAFSVSQMSLLNQIAYAADHLIDTVYEFKDRIIGEKGRIRDAVLKNSVAEEIADAINENFSEKTSRDELVNIVKSAISKAISEVSYAKHSELL